MPLHLYSFLALGKAFKVFLYANKHSWYGNGFSVLPYIFFLNRLTQLGNGNLGLCNNIEHSI